MGKQMIKAAKSGDLPTVSALLASEPELKDARDSDGSTPLHCAAWKGHKAVAEALIAEGADVNAQNTNDHWGTSPLHAAAHADNAEIVTLLLDNGAVIDAVDQSGQTPLFHTTFHKANRAAKVLKARGAV